MAGYSGMSQSSLREEILPLLTAMLKDSPQLGDSENFDLSLKLGFSGEEHASLAGLPLTRKATKALIAKYDERYEEHLAEQTFEPIQVTSPEPKLEPAEENQDDETPGSNGQMKLF
tara:strand:+ start:116 stop:463 length:348 start_codon:yes stop_codon:yes gene_type:complete